MSRFILLFEGRTGSSHLIAHLQSHPDVRAEYEPLVELKPRGWEAQRSYLAALYADARAREGTATGLKTKLRDVADAAALERLLTVDGVRVIHMTRSNRIKQIVSALNGLRLWNTRQQWNVHEGEARLAPEPFHVQSFARALELREALERELERFVVAAARPTLRLTYEELLADEPAVVARTLDFLGVARRATTSPVRKHTSDDLRQAIPNFDELKAHFAGTIYEPMFDDP